LRPAPIWSFLELGVACALREGVAGKGFSPFAASLETVKISARTVSAGQD
jgi:hypothetical protein